MQRQAIFCSSDIGQKWRKDTCLHWQAVGGVDQPLRKTGGRQTGLPRQLRGDAGQVAARRFKAGQRTAVHQGCQVRRDVFGRLQGRFAIRSRHDHHVTYIWRAHVGAQPGIDFLIGQRHWTERGQLGI